MDTIRRIIFVCTGNICRSPMALGLARREAIERKLTVELSSAGTSALDGSPASRNALCACEEREIDISAHRAMQLDPSTDSEDTVYVCMTPQHIQWLRRVAMIPAERLMLLGSGIPDPYGGDINVYRRTRDILEMEIRELFDQLAPRLRSRSVRVEPKYEPEPESEVESGPDYEEDPAPIITVMRESDLDRVADLEQRCFSDPWSRDALADSLEDPCATMLVALYDDVVCGYLCLILTDENGYIPRVCVLPAYRRRGVGTALMDAAEAAAIEFGCTDLTLEVRESNSAAIGLYESLGFASLGKRPGFYTNPIEAAIVMSRAITLPEDEQ